MSVATVVADTKDMREAAGRMRAGDRVLLSGTVYTARDAAHKRIFALLDGGGELPFPVEGAVLYYAGPAPAPPGLPIGSCGPTTSARMDIYTPRLLDLGLAGMIGKGGRSAEVLRAIVRNGAAYLCAIGGAGALACRCVTECRTVAFEDLGCEAIRRLTVRDFPLVCAMDSRGGSLFAKTGPQTPG